MENMGIMSDIKVPKEAISRQIADSVDLIIQVKRLRDGSRRTTNVTEVIGMEGNVIVTQELFKFEYLDETADGKIIGDRSAEHTSELKSLMRNSYAVFCLQNKTQK